MQPSAGDVWFYVYAVCCDGRAPVKVGMSARLVRRVYNLQSGFPERLILWGALGFEERKIPVKSRFLRMSC